MSGMCKNNEYSELGLNLIKYHSNMQPLILIINTSLKAIVFSTLSIIVLLTSSCLSSTSLFLSYHDGIDLSSISNFVNNIDSMEHSSEKEIPNVKLRRLMKEYRSKSLKQENSKPQINSPLAKYDNLGRLQCIICRIVIRNGNVWRVHLSSKAHKLKVESMRKQKDTLISNSSDRFSYNTTRTPEDSIISELSRISHLRQNSEQPFEIDKCDLITIASDESLPEGFFDDPVKDAKARNTEFKDPKDEEWERFQREIKKQSHFSNAIIADEQDEASVDRQLEEIDEQIEKWSKVMNLEKMKEIVTKQNKVKREVHSFETMETYSSDDCDSIDEFSDWRSKKSFE